MAVRKVLPFCCGVLQSGLGGRCVRGNESGRQLDEYHGRCVVVVCCQDEKLGCGVGVRSIRWCGVGVALTGHWLGERVGCEFDQ